MTESLSTPEVALTREGALGLIQLTRPRAINSLSTGMVTAIHAALDSWRDDPQVQVVAVEGEGERGLCAGGDIRMMRQGIVDGEPQRAMEFWREEYAMDATIAGYPKPYVAFMDGITMGGGIGISAHGSVRLTTECTQIAMPETIIGFFPDVGALHLLARAPGELGTYLALTGASIDGWDAVDIGLADAVLDSAAWPRVRDQLTRWPGGTSVTASGLAGEHLLSRPAGRDPLSGQREWIDAAFAGDDPREIIARLEDDSRAEAGEAARLMRQRSPWSVWTALTALRRARAMTVDEVLAQDLHLCGHVLTEPDFVEGVRAQIVDKDRTPRWRHARVEDVDPAEIRALFPSP